MHWKIRGFWSQNSRKSCKKWVLKACFFRAYFWMDFERVLEGFWEAFGRGLGGIWSLMGNFLTVLWNCFSTLTTHSKLKMGSTEKKRFQERIWRGLGTFGNDFGEILCVSRRTQRKHKQNEIKRRQNISFVSKRYPLFPPGRLRQCIKRMSSFSKCWQRWHRGAWTSSLRSSSPTWHGLLRE